MHREDGGIVSAGERLVPEERARVESALKKEIAGDHETRCALRIDPGDARAPEVFDRAGGRVVAYDERGVIRRAPASHLREYDLGAEELFREDERRGREPAEMNLPRAHRFDERRVVQRHVRSHGEMDAIGERASEFVRG